MQPVRAAQPVRQKLMHKPVQFVIIVYDYPAAVRSSYFWSENGMFDDPGCI